MVQRRDIGHELLQRLLQHSMLSLPGAIGVGLNVADAVSHRLVAAVGLATELDRAQWESGSGPLWDVLKGGQPVILPERPDERPPLHGWPGLAERVPAHDLAEVRAVVITSGEWGGLLPVLFSVYLAGDIDDELLGGIDRQEALVSSALAVVEHCAGEELRADQMLQMLQYRRVIEQAKGLVMAVTGGDAATAFATLSRASQHFNVPLRQLAIALVEHACEGTAEHPDDATVVVVPGPQVRRCAAQVWTALSNGGTLRPAPGGVG